MSPMFAAMCTAPSKYLEEGMGLRRGRGGAGGVEVEVRGAEVQGEWR
jgi:hypothetical protein